MGTREGAGSVVMLRRAYEVERGRWRWFVPGFGDDAIGFTWTCAGAGYAAARVIRKMSR